MIKVGLGMIGVFCRRKIAFVTRKALIGSAGELLGVTVATEQSGVAAFEAKLGWMIVPDAQPRIRRQVVASFAFSAESGKNVIGA